MDLEILLALQNLRQAWGPGVEQLFVHISDIGGSYIPIIVACLIYYCIDKRAGIYTFLSAFFAIFVCNFIKICVCCYRPWIRDPRIQVAEGARSGASGYSFPSGHAANTTGTYGAVGWWYRKRKPVLIICITVIVLVCFSRLFLDCHTPQDVLVGFAVGVGSIFVVDRALKWVKKGERRDVRLVVIMLVVSVALLAVAVIKPYPLDYDATGTLLVDPVKMMRDFFSCTGLFDGALVGLLFERRTADFANTRSALAMVIRVVPALVLIYVCLNLASTLSMFIGANAAYFIMASVGTFLITGGWPWVFHRIEGAMSARRAQ